MFLLSLFIPVENEHFMHTISKSAELKLPLCCLFLSVYIHSPSKKITKKNQGL